MSAYLIYHKERGIFSTYLIFDDKRIENPIPIFTKDDEWANHILTVVAYKDSTMAMEFIKDMSEKSSIPIDDLSLVEINNNFPEVKIGKKLTYWDLKDQNIGHLLGHLIHSIPMISTAIH